MGRGMDGWTVVSCRACEHRSAEAYPMRAQSTYVEGVL